LKEVFISLNLGGFDHALTALFPDGSILAVPYSGDVTEAIKVALYGIICSGYVVLVENPLVMAAEMDEEGRTRGLNLKERLKLAQLVREVLRESGVALVEIEGSPDKYTKCPIRGEKIEPAERYVIYTETEEDYEAFLEEKEEMLEKFADVIALAEALWRPSLFLVPVAFLLVRSGGLLVKEKELARLRWSVKNLDDAIELARKVRGLFPEEAELVVICWAYSAFDVLTTTK